MSSAATSAAGTGASTGAAVANAVVRLDPVSLRIKRFSALTTMTLPLAGAVAAAHLLWTGRYTATDLWLFGVMYFVHMFGVTVGFHRYLAHKAFRTSAAFEAVLMVTGSMGAQGPLMFWVTTHRRHHRFSDRQGDPHSPNLHGRDLRARVRGLWYAHMPWMLSPETTRWTVFGPDVLRNRRLMYYHRTYPLWVVTGLLVPAAVGLAVEGTATAALTGLVFGGLARIFVANQASWCVGSVCHAIGSRPFDNGDRSANNWPVAVLTFGEGLQNNHHAFPGSYRHGVTWWEPDLSGWLLAGLGRLGVVWDLRQPDGATVVKRRKQTRVAA
ncbi:acyl-CoA desaturase [Streptomyces somaliensis]|uniref:acyl-CoA desaturase n=2 Tax=Streptomyces somaliensis TaxID=78355 RepID=UPI0034E94580|nr:acyl-CoA desaturase [Streptomyces somaliensis]MCP9975872.1 acyl-CoA desaturase [Streptomyces somaliensis]